jgi:hypothetical protein
VVQPMCQRATIAELVNTTDIRTFTIINEGER